MNTYLDQLPLTTEERNKLRGLVASTPAALVGLIQASSESFRQFFGPQRTDKLLGWLKEMLTDEERQRLGQPATPYPIQGVLFSKGRAPALQPPDFDIAERDRLFNALRQLRSQPNPSLAVQRKIASIQQQLEAILS